MSEREIVRFLKCFSVRVRAEYSEQYSGRVAILELMSTPETSLVSAEQQSGASAHLFSPLRIRGIEIANRIVVSPMCQYSCEDGSANDWHLVHLGSRAIGGAGMVITEATAVESRGRISAWDLGIWKDEQIEPLARIAHFLKLHGSVPGIQLAHAGRKASTDVPWRGGRSISVSEGGWEPVAPSAMPFDSGYTVPAELTVSEIGEVVRAFGAATERALRAGFEAIELHGAHGYLLHEFVSPLSNHRADEYGGSFQNRIRFSLEVIAAVRKVWPDRLPLLFRISSTDWAEGGWTPDDSVELARAMKPLGVDVIDCSSGGTIPHPTIPLRPGYQVPFAERIRREADVLTGAVGLITAPSQANSILSEGSADLVLLAREFLREPYWPLEAAREFEFKTAVPVQYGRAFPGWPTK